MSFCSGTPPPSSREDKDAQSGHLTRVAINVEIMQVCEASTQQWLTYRSVPNSVGEEDLTTRITKVFVLGLLSYDGS